VIGGAGRYVDYACVQGRRGNPHRRVWLSAGGRRERHRVKGCGPASSATDIPPRRSVSAEFATIRCAGGGNPEEVPNEAMSGAYPGAVLTSPGPPWSRRRELDLRNHQRVVLLVPRLSPYISFTYATYCPQPSLLLQLLHTLSPPAPPIRPYLDTLCCLQYRGVGAVSTAPSSRSTIHRPDYPIDTADDGCLGFLTFGKANGAGNAARLADRRAVAVGNLSP